MFEELGVGTAQGKPRHAEPSDRFTFDCQRHRVGELAACRQRVALDIVFRRIEQRQRRRRSAVAATFGREALGLRGKVRWGRPAQTLLGWFAARVSCFGTHDAGLLLTWGRTVLRRSPADPMLGARQATPLILVRAQKIPVAALGIGGFECTAEILQAALFTILDVL